MSAAKPISLLVVFLLSAACVPAGPAQKPSPAPYYSTSPAPSVLVRPAPTASPTVTPSPAATATAVPTIASLDAIVTADLLSCRYGPGPEYLYLYALRREARIKIIGRAEGYNWAWVDGRNKCWVNARYLDIQGGLITLPVVYPHPAHLPRSPYYASTVVLSAVRTGDSVTVRWLDVPLRAGDQEDEFMLHYIVEVWHCLNGNFSFEPLATDDTSITFLDQPGCEQSSHGRVFVQEKHGFAGPAEIPWP